MVWVLWVLLALLSVPPLAQAAGEEDAQQVMQGFNVDKPTSDVVSIDKQTKERIMFYMALPLTVLLILTAILGAGMAVWGKPWFVAHMLSAGLSLSLALAHGIVGIVWFWPW